MVLISPQNKQLLSPPTLQVGSKTLGFRFRAQDLVCKFGVLGFQVYRAQFRVQG